jgi:anti-sigma-K factor RskA
MTTPPAAGERYVAIVNRGGDLPALLVNVDIATGIVAVRSVSAEAPPDRSYELWYIGEGQDPFSLGIVDRIGGELRVSIDDVRNFEPTEAVFAITDEPRGGSPTGAPTGPVVYTGVLLPAPE